MKILIVEDDQVSRRLLQKYLEKLGKLDFAVDGEEAVKSFVYAWKDEAPYDLICLDIMMPNVDGQEALRNIRGIEKEMGVKGADEAKVIMTTALGEPKDVIKALYSGATSYLTKPVTKEKLTAEMRKLGLME